MMGYHATIEDALKTLLDAAFNGTETVILNGLAEVDMQVQTFASCVVIRRDGIEFEPNPHINPDTSVKDQPEQWYWEIFVKGGGGEPNFSGRGSHVDLKLEAIRVALNAQRLTSDCGPMNLVSEEYVNNIGTGVMYVQRWTHSRLAE
jgi:hypothetical protein